MQSVSARLRSVSLRLLLLDATVLLAIAFLRAAAEAAEAAGGPAALWGLTQPLTVDSTHMASTLQWAAAFVAAWCVSAVAHGCADADAGPPEAAATRAGHAAAVAAPAALLLFLAVAGRGMAPADMAASLVVPPAAMAAWRWYISYP